MEKESISDANNLTADEFSHASKTQRENTNALFTSEDLDKSDDLANALKDLTIIDAAYYESNSAATSDKQGDSTRYPDTATHTSNEK